jgi:hypothetical protein
MIFSEALGLSQYPRVIEASEATGRSTGRPPVGRLLVNSYQKRTKSAGGTQKDAGRSLYETSASLLLHSDCI